MSTGTTAGSPTDPVPPTAPLPLTGPLLAGGRADPVLGSIADGVGLRLQGRRDEARRLLTEVWDELGAAGDPLHRCAAAHALAGVQDDATAELEWQLRALLAADQVSEGRRPHPSGVRPVSLYPSLHLNLADVHHRLGNEERARLHVQLGRSALLELAPDDARDVLAAALDRVEVRLSPAPA